MAQENIRSVVRRSLSMKNASGEKCRLAGAQIPACEAEAATIHGDTKNSDLQLLMAYWGGSCRSTRIDGSPATARNYDGLPNHLAEDLLRGAMDLQESLRMLESLRETRTSEVSKNCRRNLVPPSSDEDHAYPPRARVNLITKLMGLQDDTGEDAHGRERKDGKMMNSPRAVDIEMPKTKKLQEILERSDASRQVLRDIIETMHFKGLLKRSHVDKHHSCAVAPPIVIMKPLNVSQRDHCSVEMSAVEQIKSIREPNSGPAKFAGDKEQRKAHTKWENQRHIPAMLGESKVSKTEKTSASYDRKQPSSSIGPVSSMPPKRKLVTRNASSPAERNKTSSRKGVMNSKSESANSPTLHISHKMQVSAADSKCIEEARKGKCVLNRKGRGAGAGQHRSAERNAKTSIEGQTRKHQKESRASVPEPRQPDWWVEEYVVMLLEKKRSVGGGRLDASEAMEIEIKLSILGNHSFLTAACRFLGFPNPTAGKADAIESKKSKLYVDVAEEQLSIMDHRKNSPYAASASLTRFRVAHLTMEELVNRIVNGTKKLDSYAHLGADRSSKDRLYLKLEMDLRCADAAINGMWDVGWSEMTRSQEMDGVVREMEEQILAALIAEASSDLLV